jgi:hypothetical protein
VGSPAVTALLLLAALLGAYRYVLSRVLAARLVVIRSAGYPVTLVSMVQLRERPRLTSAFCGAWPAIRAGIIRGKPCLRPDTAANACAVPALGGKTIPVRSVASTRARALMGPTACGSSSALQYPFRNLANCRFECFAFRIPATFSTTSCRAPNMYGRTPAWHSGQSTPRTNQFLSHVASAANPRIARPRQWAVRRH